REEETVSLDGVRPLLNRPDRFDLLRAERVETEREPALVVDGEGAVLEERSGPRRELRRSRRVADPFEAEVTRGRGSRPADEVARGEEREEDQREVTHPCDGRVRVGDRSRR